MLTLIILILIAVVVIGVSIGRRDFMSDAPVVSALAMFLVIGLSAWWVMSLTAIVTEGRIDGQIEMYQAENQAIESKIEATVNNYLAYEQQTYSQLQTDDPIAVATVYPALNSMTLVQEQIQTYNDNNAKIKELKEEKINLSVDRFLIYFGN